MYRNLFYRVPCHDEWLYLSWSYKSCCERLSEDITSSQHYFYGTSGQQWWNRWCIYKAGSPPSSHISSSLHRGSTLKLKMGLGLFFSSFFVSHLCLFMLPTSTAGEPLEEVGIDFGALARTSASAISYGITQQGFAILGQSHLLFLITFYCIILKIFVIFQPGPFLACLDLWHTPSWFQTEGSNCRSQLQF